MVGSESSNVNPNQSSSASPKDATESIGETPDSFETLIAKARQGDPKATGVLVEQYRKYLLLIANEDMGHELQAKMGASDLVQESMMLAQKKIGQFRGASEQEWRGWLRSILNHDLLKSKRKFAAKKRNANQEVNIQEHSAVGRKLVDEQLTPSSEAVKQEKVRLLNMALGKLDPDHRQIIQLRNFEQISFEEIGGEMRRSEDAARKLWARAIEALQRVLIHDSPDLISGQHKAINDHE